ncbi:MAG: DNA-binding protein [Porticoccaceae bacterium]|jgi:DNA-binding phage protein
MTSQACHTEDYLDSPETTAAYLDAALEDDDKRVLLLALRNVPKKIQGMSKAPTPARHCTV